MAAMLRIDREAGDAIRKNARKHRVLMPDWAETAGIKRAELNNVLDGHPASPGTVAAVLRAARFSDDEAQVLVKSIEERAVKEDDRRRRANERFALRCVLNDAIIVRYFDVSGKPVAVGLDELEVEDFASEVNRSIVHCGIEMERWPEWLKIGHHIRVEDANGTNHYPVIKHIVSYHDTCDENDGATSIGVILDFEGGLVWGGKWPAAPVNRELYRLHKVKNK